ncbi:Aste57867_12350 [Aphanomyces stellatus]|uniref:Aste57867_12350 protein n=1 Tax=Aphanomyces stellatus TaxID=120398 RepID=A0A485KVC9_9STRA|nr:hypothetical protein As57867_012304 [Aphanomyces stellatus]VFT89202.1 Aste57867_12350 [Aphanomyces stellatus]
MQSPSRSPTAFMSRLDPTRPITRRIKLLSTKSPPDANAVAAATLDSDSDSDGHGGRWGCAGVFRSIADDFESPRRPAKRPHDRIPPAPPGGRPRTTSPRKVPASLVLPLWDGDDDGDAKTEGDAGNAEPTPSADEILKAHDEAYALAMLARRA